MFNCHCVLSAGRIGSGRFGPTEEKNKPGRDKSPTKAGGTFMSYASYCAAYHNLIYGVSMSVSLFFLSLLICIFDLTGRCTMRVLCVFVMSYVFTVVALVMAHGAWAITRNREEGGMGGGMIFNKNMEFCKFL